MAKPDQQHVRVTPAGELLRDKGKLGLELAFENLLTAADDTAATSSGVALGGLYINSGTGAITRRLV